MSRTYCPILGEMSLKIKNCGGKGSRGEPVSLICLSFWVSDDSPPPPPRSRQHMYKTSEHFLNFPFVCFQVDLKGEIMNMAKISDSGKKQRKNWSSVWTVLTSDQLIVSLLIFIMSNLCKADVLQLCGAFIEWNTEKSSRKNVFQIKTSTGSEYLVQTDSYSTASKWYDAIKKTIDSSVRSHHPLKSSSLYSLFINYKLFLYMFGSSKLKHSASDSADKNGVKNRLKKFIIRRPSMKTLQEKGLIKDRVFGCHLSSLCEREGTTVPKFVRICVDAVEKRGLEADGIYRVSGNLATIQKLRFLVDEEEDLDLEHSQWEDVHVVTGALKMFFRELPEPLFPFRFFQPFVEAIKPKQKVQAVKKLIQQLPKPNHDTMKLLFSHLHKVLAFSRKNLMSTQGIGIVFGPTLMWPELDAGNMAVNMVYQNQIVEFILTESQEIFNLDGK
uniref:Rho GTPase-activating protein 15 n=1 Tax=Astatotilapia calliptera TaxID=8154 RepID=A0A3P8Q803_ASTCA